jgi:ABC-type transport system involved in multi-copper enzyme maturation permease subunit
MSAADSTSDADRHLSPLRQAATVVRTDLTRLLGEHRTIGLAFVQLLPIVAAILMVHVWSFDGLSIYTSLIQYVEFPLIVPLVAIFYGGPVLVNEMEGRTLTFLTLRPVPKPVLYLGKWAAGALVSLLLVLAPILILFVNCLVATGSLGGSGVTVGKTLLAASLAVLAYSAIFAALGAMFATNLVAGIVYFVVVEMILGNLPTLELLTVRFHARNIAGFSQEQSSQMLSQLLPVESLSLAWWTSALIVVGMTAAASLVGALVFQNRQYHV